jgi:hypothetical protein
MPSSHFFFFLKKKSKRGGRPPPIGWFGHPSIYLYIFFLAFSYFLGFFFCFLRKNVMGHFGNNKAKWVKLPQFKTLGGGVKCHFLNFGGKSENRWILQGGKM